MTDARDLHRRLDAAHAEAQARDGGEEGGPDIHRSHRWRQDSGISGGRREVRVPLLELKERTSAKGTRYLSGWMGKARLVGFLAEAADPHGNQVWNIFAVEPEPRKAGEGDERR